MDRERTPSAPQVDLARENLVEILDAGAAIVQSNMVEDVRVFIDDWR